MTQAKWDGAVAAPKGLFRVIGEDGFSMPPEQYWIGDYKDYEAAKDAARAKAGPMNPISVYDEKGKVKFIIY